MNTRVNYIGISGNNTITLETSSEICSKKTGLLPGQKVLDPAGKKAIFLGIGVDWPLTGLLFFYTEGNESKELKGKIWSWGYSHDKNDLLKKGFKIL